MVSFTCNICGTANAVAEVPWEEPTCSGCKSNVRARALIYLLSAELYGKPRPLPEFPRDKSISGFGLSDDWLYARPLGRKFDYTNTFYDREPYLDITQPHTDLYGSYDFILSSDVFEHVAPPLERALEEAFRLLKPNGFLCITVPSAAGDAAPIEYYPDLHQYTVVDVNGERLLVNRKRDQTWEVHEHPEFHGGIGATLVMRQLSQGDLARKLMASGFSEACFLTESIASYGIRIDPWGRPLVARKVRYSLSPMSDRIVQVKRLTEEKATLEQRVAELESQWRMAADSRWLKLGRMVGLGPKFR